MSRRLKTAILALSNGRIGRLFDRLRAYTVRNPHTISVGDVSASFYVDTPYEYHRTHRLMGEEVVIQRFLGDLRDGDIVWDVGANIGIYACLATAFLARSGEGLVVGFEPHEPTRNRLKENLSLNGGVWQVISSALGDDVGEARLSGGESIGVGSNTLVTEGPGRPVSLTRAEHIVAEGIVPAPDVVKIDVEGGELPAIKGFDSLLSNLRILYVEVHVSRGVSERDVRDYLTNHGLEVSNILQRGDDLFLRAERTVDSPKIV